MGFLKKTLLNLVLLAVIAVPAVIILQKYQPGIRLFSALKRPCSAPLKYSIGEIDPRFRLTKDQLQEMVAEASQIWNKASGSNLFEYDPNAPLQIKMVYDGRQQETDAASELETNLKNLESKRGVLSDQYSSLSAEYEQKLAVFKAAVDEHKKRLEKYNQKVEYWNEQGGAPEDEYDKLKKEQDSINKNYDKLNKHDSALQDLAKRINSLAAQENKIVNNYNAAVTTFKNKYGGAQEFEKGVFDPAQGIIIYQFREKDDLILTLVHELGHALGIGHVENPQSIMNYMMGEQDLDNPTFTNEDMAALRSICRL